MARKAIFIRSRFLPASVLLALLCLVSADSKEPEEGLNELILHSIQKRAIDSLSRIISPFSSLNPFSLTLRETARSLSAATLYSIFHVFFLMFSGYFLIGAIAPLIGFGRPVTFRSLTDGIGALQSLDYNRVIASIQTLPERSFQTLDIKGAECKSRAVCELGNAVATYLPSFGSYVENYGNAFNVGNKYTSAMLKGMKQVDCGITYSNCPTSPFKKWSNLWSVVRL